MVPIRLTSNHYINSTVVAKIEFDPAGTMGSEPYFTAIFVSADIEPVQLRGPEAEETMRNWAAAYERNAREAPSSGEGKRVNLRDLCFQIADSELLDEDLARVVKNGEDVDLEEILKALVIGARDCEAMTSNDPAATWIERRLARACLIASFLIAIVIVKE